MFWFSGALTLSILLSIVTLPNTGRAAEFTVYSVYQHLDMGNENEKPLKDFYINMGSEHGLRKGSIVTVIKRVPTYDAVSEKLYREMAFPYARLKIVHAEQNLAVGRIEKVLPQDNVPAVNPQAIMVGDIVRLAE
jgi:hypothetical protein